MTAPVAAGRSDVSEELAGPQPLQWPPRTLLGYVETVVEALALVGFVAVMLVTLLQVLTRFVLYVPMPWTEELARILFVASSLIGIALATRRHEHIVVDVVFDGLSARGKAMVALLFDAAILVLLTVWFRGAALMVGVNAQATYVSIPWLRVAHMYMLEAACIGLIAVFVLADMTRNARLLRVGAPSFTSRGNE